MRTDSHELHKVVSKKGLRKRRGKKEENRCKSTRRQAEKQKKKTKPAVEETPRGYGCENIELELYNELKSKQFVNRSLALHYLMSCALVYAHNFNSMIELILFQVPTKKEELTKNSLTYNILAMSILTSGPKQLTSVGACRANTSWHNGCKAIFYTFNSIQK